jgi:hypothetical protein
MTDETDLDPEEVRLRQVAEQQDSFEREHEDDPSFFQKGYVRGVELITGKKRWGRALPKFRAFLESQAQTKEAVEQLDVKYRQNGFSGAKIIRLRDDFVAWWKEEKSRKAKQNRAKRGRVKSKNDKRLGARLRKKI